MHAVAPAAQTQLAAHRQLRVADVEAGLPGRWPFAREARVTLQQDGLARRERQCNAQFVTLHLRGVAALGRPAQEPVAQVDLQVLRAGPDAALGLCRWIAVPAGDALVVPQLAGLHVGDGGMGKQQLPRGQPAGQGLRHVHPAAEEGHLEAEGPPGIVLGVAGQVPPFGARVVVAAVVARKDQWPRLHREHRGEGPGQRRQQQGTSRQQRHHQSSFTACTASRLAAARPDSQAVRVPASTTATHNASRRPEGRVMSMVQ